MTQSNESLKRVDHLIFGAASLDAGIQAIEEILGVRPGPGGRHPAFGTCNALLSLGPETYLEVIAPDPGLPAPEQGRLFDLGSLETPRLVTWVLRTYDIDDDVARAASGGVTLGAVDEGSRTNPDGSVLRWRLTDPYVYPLDGAAPFLLDWGNAPHPGGSAPPAGSITGLRFETPNAAAVRSMLKALDLGFGVDDGAEFQLAATLETARGPVVLR
ncbi:MAG: VOC family protein [Acidobacteria bacterium]|nr:VOC family protein [Acidobacteriota bacterium]